MNTRKTASISKSGIYRYSLTRIWDSTVNALGVVMLNPSTADASKDDPTIRRCIGFAKRDGYGGIHVCNLFAYRATKPADLMRATGRVGSHNDHALDTMFMLRPTVLCAWGAQAGIEQRVAEFMARYSTYPMSRMVCLGTTKSGAPRHPLYVHGQQPLVAYPS